MNIDSLIFDLDGTLWDAIDTLVLSCNDVLKNHPDIKKNFSRKDFESVMGMQLDDISKKFFNNLNETDRNSIMKEFCIVEQNYLAKNGGKLYPNLEETLLKLSRKFKLFIVSNCQVGYIETFLKYHKLEKYFIDFENPGRTNLSKGENINLIIKRNNLKNPVYVGDTTSDLEAAKFANIPFIYANYGFGNVNEYDYAINNIEDLLNF
ncbi:HAD family hydrolase [Clostridium ihumii]|uniref:HAD family hydrolase n=1 Tax=Clostridium ihumii TaxID=1470356 RepID=UPI003D3263AC